MIKAVVFDLWETLGSKNIMVSRVLAKHFGLGNDFLRKYEESIQLREWECLDDLAVSFLTAFDIVVSKDNIRFVVDTVQKGIVGDKLFVGVREILEGLKVKLAILSNTSNFESEVVKSWGVSDLFAVQVYSWQVGCLKPSSKSFKEVCKQLKVRPDECVYVDDSVLNIKAAKRFGFKAVQFKGVKQLKMELKKLEL